MFGSGATESLKEIDTYAKTKVNQSKSEIDAKASQASSQIDTKASQAIASIPSDYTALVEEVEELSTNKYEKPNSGIPKTDLSSSVQSSLDKADSAYIKPNSGIPKTDLASDVIIPNNMKSAATYELDLYGYVSPILSCIEYRGWGENKDYYNYVDEYGKLHRRVKGVKCSELSITKNTRQNSYIYNIAIPDAYLINILASEEIRMSGFNPVFQGNFANLMEHNMDITLVPYTWYEEEGLNVNFAICRCDSCTTLEAFKEYVKDKYIFFPIAEEVVDVLALQGNIDRKIESNTVAIDNRIKKFFTSNLGASSVSDSDDGAIRDLKIYGNTQQTQLSGKNLLNCTLQTTTQDGVTCTRNSDGTYTLNGTATANIFLDTCTDVNLSNGVTYKLVGCPSGGDSEKYMLRPRGQDSSTRDIGSGCVFTYNSSYNDYTFLIRIGNGTVCNNVIFKPMVVDYSLYPTATYSDYEPYCGGIPSPNPDYPQDIHAVENPMVEVIGEEKSSNNKYGVCVDFEAKTFTRIADSVGKTEGADFNNTSAFGGRRRCNVSDDGKILAFYGDDNYKEDGSNGQVMVYQPRFYYKVEALKVDGQNLRKANYYVSDVCHEGFKIHPLFVKNGRRVPYVLLSAYEGSSYDTSASAYNKTDAQTVDFNADKMASISSAKPISGLTQSLTRANARKLASNRGNGWSISTIQSTTATELLFLVEYASFNMQSKLGVGVTNKTDDGSTNMAEITGATTSLGNNSGAVTNSNGYNVISYRGEENFYGNIWKFVDGINVYNYGEGTVHIADHGFADNTKSAPYEDAGITICGASGYVSAFAYNTDYDWLFIASECSGNNQLPVGDYFYQNKASNQYTVARLGGSWSYGSAVGGFYWDVHDASSYRVRVIGGRLLYVPNSDDEYDRYKHATLNDITLYKIGDVADYVDVEAKGWWQKIGSVDLGSITWSTSGFGYSKRISNVKYVSANTELGKGLAEKYKMHTGSGMSGVDAKGCIAIDTNTVCVNVDGTTTSGNTPSGMFYFELETPIFHQLTDEQLADFLALRSYYPTTNLTVTSDDINGSADFLYPCSLENFVEYIKEQQGDTREFVYDMADIADQAFINAQYAEILAELNF